MQTSTRLDICRRMRGPMSTRRAALAFVLFTVFIDSLGFGIIIPSLLPVIVELTGAPVGIAATWSGYLMAVYALLQFFMGPVFGNLSDRFGRRPILLGSLFAFGVDFLLTGLARSMAWLFVGRAFAGVFGASFAAAGAYIGDISNDENRAKNFGFIGAAWGSGFTLGLDVGAQIPLAPSKVRFDTKLPATIPQQVIDAYVEPNNAKVRNTLDTVGRTILPTLNFRIGWLI